VESGNLGSESVNGHDGGKGDGSMSLLSNRFSHHLIIWLLLATLIVSLFSLINVYQLKKSINPDTIKADDLLNKLSLHEEMESYAGVAPLNIIQVDYNNLGSLQAQFNGLDISYIGDFIVQYPDRIIIYNLGNDTVKSLINIPKQVPLPEDFFIKLNRHLELKGLSNEQPIGSQLDEASLNVLKQQSPEVYKDANPGDIVLRYQTKLIIYNYEQDIIVNSVDLS
jgi:hypothetical protein